MLKIIASNVRKAKTGMITLVALLIFASMLLNIGLTVALSLPSFFTEKVRELKVSDLIYMISVLQDKDSFKKDVESLDGIKEAVFEELVFIAGVSIKKEDLEISNSFNFLNLDNTESSSSLQIIDRGNQMEENSILLPLSFRNSYGYQSGDTILINMAGQELAYKINGFFEDVFFGSSSVTMNKAYLAGEAYEALKAKLLSDSNTGLLVSIYLKDAADANPVLKEISKLIDKHELLGFWYGLSLDTARQIGFTFVNILVMIVLGFSLIMVVISLIVVVFSILSSVEDGIQNIGVLKALGYRNAQIVWALVLQYGSVGVLGSGIGLFCSVLALPFVGNLTAESAGLLWNLSFHSLAAFLSLLIILGLVLIITSLCAAKIKKITPIKALRSGLETHSFKRNHFPLSGSRLNITVLIVLKTIFHNLKQNLMVVIIVMTLSFASVFSLLMYSNMVEDTTVLMQKIGIPLSDVWVLFNQPTEQSKKAFFEMDSMPEVKSIAKYEQMPITIMDINDINVCITDDFSTLPKNAIMSGRYPIYDNEIAISSVVAKGLGKKLGEILPITLRGKTFDFLICGITEQLADNGLVADLGESAMQRFISDYTVKGLVIKLDTSTNIKAFIKELEQKYGHLGINCLNIQTTLDNIVLSFEGGVSVLMAVVIGIMIIVITLILYLMIKMKIMREKTNIGIYKAGGFTTFQLMAQISLSFTIVLGLGTLLGAVLGGLYSNHFVALLMSSMGVSTINFQANYRYITYLVIAITFLAFLISNGIALRIRKITAYHLLVE